MALGAASNAAAGAAAATSTIVSTAAMAGTVAAGISAATATVAASASLAVVGVAGVASGTVLASNNATNTVQAAASVTACAPNPVIAPAYTKIVFHADEFPDVLPSMVEQAYNDAAGCSETYKRVSVDAALELTGVWDYGPAILHETWWSMNVSCSPRCPYGAAVRNDAER